MKLVCVGDNVADFYPEEGILYPGGSTYNVAVLARRYGARTAYLGTFGNDIAGQYLLEVMKEEGVDCSHASILEGKNAIARIANKGGESQVLNVDKGVYRDFSLSEEDLEFIKGFECLHTTVYSYIEKYLPFFKENGLAVSFDFSFMSAREYLAGILPYVDIAFFSAVGLEGDIKEFMKEVSNSGPEQVIVTMGKEGVLTYYGQEFYYHPAREVEVVHTLGAGDAFIAMYLTALGQGYSIEEILEKATDKAAECCTMPGTFGRGITTQGDGSPVP